MPHKRSSQARLKRMIRNNVLRKAYWDKRLGECISMIDARTLKIIKGEVLYDSRSYISPSLEEE